MDNCCDVESSELDTISELNATMRSLVDAYFGSGKAGEVVGTLYERRVFNTLISCGYQRFPIKKIEGSPTVTLGGPSPFNKIPVTHTTPTAPACTQPDANLQGEVDALVCGNESAFKALCKACPYNHIHPISSNDHILVCEAKVSSTEAIKKMYKKGAVKSDYWIFDNSFPISFNVLFVNGGEESKEWVANGGNSSNASAKAVWDELNRCKVSIFYRESFSHEWVTDTSKALECLSQKVTELKDELETSKTAIERLNEELKIERETSKAIFADMIDRIQKLEAGAKRSP